MSAVLGDALGQGLTTVVSYSLFGLNTSRTIVAGKDVLRVAEGRRLRASVARSLERVRLTCEALLAAQREGKRAASALLVSEPRAGLEPLRELRSRLSDVAQVLQCAAGLPANEPASAEAKRAFVALYPTGTSYLSGAASEVDHECGLFLDAALKRDQAERLTALGLAPFVRAVRVAHEALRASRESQAESPARRARPGVAEARRAALAALREYVKDVQAASRTFGDGLDEVLLAPLRDARGKRARADAESEGPPSAAA